jgi:hypothetical protein
VNAIATVATAAATAAAVAAAAAVNAVSAAMSLPFVGCLLCAPIVASVSTAVAFPHHFHCWLPTALAMVAILTNVSLQRKRRQSFSGVMFKILL